jgi:hypothetical protein
MMLAKAASTKTRLNNNTAIVFNDFPSVQMRMIQGFRYGVSIPMP